MVHNPGGDWHPGRGDNPIYIYIYHIYRVCNPSYPFLMPFIGVITPVRSSKGPSCKPTIEDCLCRKAKNYVTHQ